MSGAKLPKDDEVLRQHFIAGLGNKEIAAMYGCCDAAVSRRRVLITGVSKKAPPPPPPSPEGSEYLKGRLRTAPDHRRIVIDKTDHDGDRSHLNRISLPRVVWIHGEFNGTT